MEAVMMVLMVEMMLMMIPMMHGVTVMTMMVIPPLREGNPPADFSLPQLFFSLSGFCLVEAVEKLFIDTPMVLGQREVIRRRGAGGGLGAGPTHGLGWTRGRGPPLLPRTYFPKYYPPNFSGIFGASDVM